MATIAKYKFNSSLYADYLPTFNAEFTGYTKTDVNNGDGTITRTISHDTLKPTFMRFGATSDVTDREKSLLEVMECDTSEVTNMGNMFSGCSSLTSLDVSNFNTSKVTNMSYMFNACKLLTSLDLSNFDTGKVTNMNSMFENCQALTLLNISGWNTSKVTDMAYMFNQCYVLTSLDVSSFNTSQVTNTTKMFSGCSKLTSLVLSSFNTSNVTAMNSMFEGCASITTLDASNFNTSSVNNMSGMFYNCNKLTSLDLSNFNTSSVNNMSYMFQYCSSLTSLDLSSFDTSNVTSMLNMFSDCSKLISLDLSSFDTSKVTSMNSMFTGCSSLTSLDVSNFNTSQVTNMSATFGNCSSLTSLDLSGFNTSEVTDMSFMFRFSSSLVSLDLSNWNTNKLTNMTNMFDGCTSLVSLDLSNFNTDKVTNMNWAFYNCPVPDIGLLYATSSTINSLLTPLGTDVARNIYYMDAPLNELTVQDNITYKKYELSKATLPYTLNKLPNGVADYIDVVNKVHVQRVGKVTFDGSENWSCPNNLQEDETVVAVLNGQEYSEIYNNGTNASTGLCDKLGMGMSATTKTNIYNPDGTWVLSVLKTELSSSTLEGIKQWLSQKQPTVLGQLKTPIYTPLTEEEIAQLPLSAYKDGYVNLSSDQLTPSFEFRMKASNRYQVDMLETGYYYLNAPVGNVKLGTASVDVQQMPCIVKVDNVGTGDSGYRLITSATSETYCLNLPLDFESGYLNISNGNIVTDSAANGRWTSDFIEIPYYNKSIYIINKCQGVDLVYYDENKSFIGGAALGNVDKAKECWLTGNTSAKYMRMSGKNDEMVIQLRELPITLAKLPSHRIPTTFTQGMRCGTDFGYWEGVKESNAISFRTVNTSSGWSIVEASDIEGGMGIVLNRIEYNNTIVEDEFDIATGKLIKRVGVKLVTVEDIEKISNYGTDGNSYYCYGFESMFPNWKSRGIFKADGINYWKSHRQIEPSPFILEFYMSYIVGFSFDLNYSYDDKKRIIIDVLNNTGGFTVYYELEVPEISYVNLSSNQVKTVANTGLQCAHHNGYLNPQIKPSHLTYPVPSLVGNRTYTVVHNRKNINGSTKPIELNLGGTVVQLNDASNKTLVKTPSTLAHSSLIFIGGESTVDHIMVLDGDWTNKPIEYFENMMGHDTDAIITIIGNGQINDVEEQYLW